MSRAQNTLTIHIIELLALSDTLQRSKVFNSHQYFSCSHVSMEKRAYTAYMQISSVEFTTLVCIVSAFEMVFALSVENRKSKVLLFPVGALSLLPVRPPIRCQVRKGADTTHVHNCLFFFAAQRLHQTIFAHKKVLCYK